MLGFGSWATGGTGWGGGTCRAEHIAAIEAAFDRGIRFFDTAPTYGDAERLLGRALHGRRGAVTIATKVGPRDDCRRSLEESLRRLRTDYVDVLQLHEVGERFERSLEELAELQREGKARAAGLCNATPDQMARARQVAGITTYQGPYNLFDREAEQRHLPSCAALGLSFLAYRPLASGMLTDAFAAVPRTFAPEDHRSRIYWFRGPELARRRHALALLQPIARRLGVTLSALALAWLLSRPGVAVVLAGARTPAQVDENAAAAAVSLSPGDEGEIASILAAAFPAARATPRALAAAGAWGERERFIAQRLDGRTSADAIAAQWTDLQGTSMIAAQVTHFIDQLAARSLVTFDA